MEPMPHQYTTVFAIAQHGPHEGKPFFGFVPAIKTTQAEYEAKLHYEIARAVVVEQGCAPDPMVFCVLDDVPEFLIPAFCLACQHPPPPPPSTILLFARNC